MKFISFLFVAILALNMVSAVCSVSILKGLVRDTTGKPIDNYIFDLNSTVLVGISVSRHLIGNSSNLDVILFDALQKQVSFTQITLNSTTFYAEVQFHTSEQLLNGTYKIITLHNETINNMSVCNASNQAEILISTNRTAYNSSPIDIAIGLNTPLSRLDSCKKVQTQGIQYDICLNGTAPIGYDFTVNKVTTLSPENASDTNYSLLIKVSTPYYSYDIVNGLFQKYMDFNTSVSQMTSNLAEQIRINNAFVNITSQQNEDRYNSLLNQYLTAQKDIQNQKNASYWLGIFVGFFPGMIFGVVLFFGYMWWKSKKTSV
jgi:2C-methyl-D-erythritol 2,4-cyclodiphosphate synthase